MATIGNIFDQEGIDNGRQNLPINIRQKVVSQGSSPSMVLENKFTVTILHLLKFGIFILLASLVAVLGAVSFTLLRRLEMENFNNAFHSSVKQISGTIDVNLRSKLLAGSVVNNIWGNAIKSGYAGNLPNVTLPGYLGLMNTMADLAYAREISFLPLITSKNRRGWEAYAKAKIDFLEGPPALYKSIDGSWPVSNGCYRFGRDGKKVSSSGWNQKSMYPDIILPTWQISHVDMFYDAVMYDAHSNFDKAQVLDRAISTKKPAFTDIIQIKLDTELRPSTNLYYPITTIDTNEVVGISVLGFSWDDVLKGTLPSYLSGFTCVLSTDTQVYTFELSYGRVNLMGRGDLHDNKFDHYKTIVSINSSELTISNYTIVLYPTNELFEKYVTDTPAIATGSIVGVIVFTAMVILCYLYLLLRRERRLTGTVESTTKVTNMTLHELEVKKSFVRYISHEIRTPLNTVKLGLDVLENELEQGAARTNMRTSIQDIKDSCHAALEVVNDFLLFDKIVSETLVLERAPMNVHTFVSDSLRPIYISAKQKNINLDFINDLPENDVGRRLNINIDNHKMAQVMRNLLSNALKFTPQGGSVTVTLRQAEVDVSEEYRPAGFLVTVRDTGVGISEENQSKLFEKIVQFSPNDLQGGGGSGLGLYISHSILRKHGGNLSVSSGGIGQGTTFIMQLPRHENRTPLLEYLSNRLSSGRLGRSYFSSLNISTDADHRQPHGNHILSTYSKDVDTSKSIPVKKVVDVEAEIRLDMHFGQETDNPVPSIHVLLVDGTATNRRMLSRMLSVNTYQHFICHEAVDGVEAIKKVKCSLGMSVEVKVEVEVESGNPESDADVPNNIDAIELNGLNAGVNGDVAAELAVRFDVIIIDYVMPHMCGPETVKTIRDVGFRGLIIGVTSHAEESYKSHFLESGADMVLMKPLNGKQLLALIEEYLFSCKHSMNFPLL